jgi:hypothetical protein
MDWTDKDTLKRLQDLEDAGRQIAGPSTAVVPNTSRPLPPPVLPPPGSATDAALMAGGGVSPAPVTMNELKKKPLWGK